MKTSLQSWIVFAKKQHYPIVGRFHTEDNQIFHLTYMGQTIIKKFDNRKNENWFAHFKVGRHHICNLIFLDNHHDGVLIINVT